MSRLPLPSRWTLLVEFVIVSISPVPKLEPGPVSYIHWEPAPEPAAPLKSSLKMVDQPDGGPGTAAGAAATEVAGSVAAAMATTGTAMIRAPVRHRRMTDPMAGGRCNEKLVMTSLPHPAPWPKQIGRCPICGLKVTQRSPSVNGSGHLKLVKWPAPKGRVPRTQPNKAGHQVSAWCPALAGAARSRWAAPARRVSPTARA